MLLIFSIDNYLEMAFQIEKLRFAVFLGTTVEIIWNYFIGFDPGRCAERLLGPRPNFASGNIGRKNCGKV